MALIGNWGDFTFYVSADQIKTFDSLKWDSAAKYSTHDRHLREPLLCIRDSKWVITKLSNSLKRFDRWGNLLVASVNVTMQSYAVR